MSKICPSCGESKDRQAQTCKRCMKHPKRSPRTAAIAAICKLIDEGVLAPYSALGAAILITAIANGDWPWLEENGPFYMEGIGLGDWDIDTLKKRGLEYFRVGLSENP